jgi:hypothetical protein
MRSLIHSVFAASHVELVLLATRSNERLPQPAAQVGEPIPLL